MSLQCLIVDDEPLAQDVLEDYIGRVPELTLLKKCSTAMQAHTVMQKHKVDLIFLDIHMPVMSGVEFARSLKHAPAVIFTTAYSKYAVEGFNLDAVDYLLKPIAFDRFLKSVNKVVSRLALKKENKVAAHAPASGDPAESDFMFVKADKKLVKVSYREINYIEGLKDYVMIYTTQGRIITLLTMKSLEEKLPAGMFIRIHRSFIVSMAKLSSVTSGTVEVSGKHLPIGKLYRDTFMHRVDRNNLVK
jgi:DNA-binding LytR/AlgR family response regulator